jgi:hypothetical protein
MILLSNIVSCYAPLSAESTIETRIQTLQQQKYMLADEVIKGEIEDWDPESQS